MPVYRVPRVDLLPVAHRWSLPRQDELCGKQRGSTATPDTLCQMCAPFSRKVTESSELLITSLEVPQPE